MADPTTIHRGRRSALEKTNLIGELAGHIAGKYPQDLAVGPCGRKLGTRIDRLDIPRDLQELLKGSWFNQPYQLNMQIFSVEEIVTEEDQPRYLADGLLQVGCTLVGDPIALDLREREFPVRFVSHDLLWEREGTTPRGCSVLVYDQLVELFLRLAEGFYIPMDVETARQFRAQVEAMRG